MSIAEIKSNRVVITHRIIQVQTEISSQEWLQPFGEDIAASIEEMKAFAATDVLAKDGKMSGYWIIANNVNKDVLSRDLHHKRWEHNSLGSAEVIVLLELLTVLKKRGRNMNDSKIVIGIDYRRAHRKTLESIRKSNEYAQESGAEIAKIKSLLEKIKFDVEIKLILGHESSSISHSSNPIKHLMKTCDERSRRKGRMLN